MAGGKGERFWPASRLARPKHLLPIVGDKPMLAQTVERLEGFVPKENILVITNVEQLDAVREVCAELPAENIVGEPIGRDTAPAVGLAMVLVRRKNPDAVFAMLPADHVIHEKAKYQEVLNAAFAAAEAEKCLVTIGIKPDFPSTGYGYIHFGEELDEQGGHRVLRVKRFVEKPDEETAKQYLDSGEYFWNAGMFIWQVAAIQDELQRNCETLSPALDKIATDLEAGEAMGTVLEREYPKLEKISIDYAVMEKAQKVVTVPSAFDWDDVGEWRAIERHQSKDSADNALRGDAFIQDGSGNIVYSEGGHLVTLLGVDDLIVVRTEDATLICPKDRAQDVKKLVKALGNDERWRKLT